MPPMYDMELDTLDIVVAVAAIVAGFSLLTMTGWWDFEEEVICLILAATLGLKRLYIPTASKREDASMLARLLFLFLAITGAGAAVLSLVCVYTDQGLRAAASPAVVLQSAGWPLLLGAGALLLAFCIERAALRG
jgi:hypothetical protein